jgi:hypothetical protein
MGFDAGGDGPGGLSRRSMLLGLMLGATSVRTQGRPASPDTEIKTESMQLGSTEPSTTKLTCGPIIWRDRHAYVLENDLIRLVTLTGGGHIAEFRFREESGLSKVNPLWTPPWKGIEPYLYRENVHAARYSAPPTGQLLSGIAGHNLCLDYFGGPSNEEAKQGLPIHGEAGISLWHNTRAEVKGSEAILEMSVKLPVAGLSFTRQIKIRRGESVAYFTEEVVNEKKADHFFHWTQHATLGPPFLSHEHSRIFISATRGRTLPHGYEGKELLATAQDFQWPNAPGVDGTPVDLRRPLSHPGLGFVATVLMDPGRDQQYVAGLNIPERLLVAYCFDRKDFPWTAIWEENKARADAPWNSESETRGLEFGSTPLPVGRREAFANGPLFGAPCFSVVPALGRATVRYAAFLTQVPAAVDNVGDIRLANGEIHVVHSTGIIQVPAGGVSESGMAAD